VLRAEARGAAMIVILVYQEPQRGRPDAGLGWDTES